MDPLTASYPWYTPYQFAGNKPIWAVDLDGLEEKKVTYVWDNPSNWSPGQRRKIIPENAAAVSTILSVREQYELAVKRYFEPGKHYLPEDQYVDESFGHIEYLVGLFFDNNTPRWSTSTTATNIVHIATVYGIFSNDKEKNKQAIEIINRADDILWSFPLSDLIGGGTTGRTTFRQALKIRKDAIKILKQVNRRRINNIIKGLKAGWETFDITKTIDNLGYDRIELGESGKVI